MRDPTKYGAPPVYDAPMALDEDLSRTHGLAPNIAGARNRGHIWDLRKRILGPMPAEDFVEIFVGPPVSDAHTPLSAHNAFKSVPPTAETPAQIYEPLIVALNKRTKRKTRCLGFVFEDTARRSVHPRRLGYAKPHVTCFAEHNLQAVHRSDPRSRTELGYAELFIQVTADRSRDFFVDPPFDIEDRATHDFLAQSEDPSIQEEMEKALGLHIGFATEILARQHRSFAFSISMAGSRARLLRWDRAGCVVSEAFDIREHPEHLCTFIWKFTQGLNSSRGYDPTMVPADNEQEKQFKAAVREYVKLQLGLEGEALEKALCKHYSPGHVAVVKVFPHPFSASAAKVRIFLISRPVISPLSLVSRGTRGYWAVDVASSRVSFLKDTWRIASSGSVEGELLDHLNRRGVRNIPTVAIHGDVPRHISRGTEPVVHWQHSYTDMCLEAPWICPVGGTAPSVRKVQCYRLVMDTVGYGLSTVQGTEELLHVMYDVFIAMQDALAKDSRIHRDLSLGNVILVKEPGRDMRKGYLIDWEVSDIVDEEGKSTHSGRAGTWPFSSWRMLDWTEEHGRHTILDDMDSLVHVITYCALHYLPHSLSPREIGGMIKEYYEDSVTVPGIPMHGGTSKRLNVVNRRLLKIAEFGSAPLVEWLNDVLDLQRAPGLDLEFGKKFTPGAMDMYWSAFLKTHTLPRDDRVVHKVIREAKYDSIPPSDRTVSLPASSLGKRSSAERDPTEGAPVSKRSASSHLQTERTFSRRSALHGGMSPGPLSTSVRGPRRSERLASRQNCVSGRVLVAAMKPQPRVARLTSKGRREGRSRK
ncbi:hypothetical protein C8Q78DRAFT_974562 [Trametes maxima]|nr:hypothetical protein C8Q78DRAFT_974562 [Trametes maxima]